jgi:hypothetical protein
VGSARWNDRKPALGGASLAGIAGIAYVALATRSIDKPGLYMDELINTVPALNFVHGPLPVSAVPGTGPAITVGHHSLTVMTLEYLGALKSAAFLPVAALVDVSPASVRGFAIFFGALALLATWAFARRLFRSSAVAGISTALLALDPGFVFYTREDVGPTAIMLLLRGIAGWQLLRWWDTRQTRSLAVASFAVGLAVYDKANFAWVLIACAVALAAMAGRTVLERLSRRDVFVAGAGFLLGALPLLVYNLRSGFATLHANLEGELAGGYFSQLRQRFELVDRLLDGSAGERLVGLPTTSSPLPWLVLAAAVAILVQCTRRRPLTHELKAGLFVVLSGVILILVLAAFPSAYQPYHVILVYPFPQLALGLVAFQGARALIRRAQPRGHRRTAVFAGAAALVAVPIVLAFVASASMIHELGKSGGRGLWSPRIYGLEGYLVRHHAGKPIELLDFGLSYNLIGLSQGRLHMDDVSFTAEFSSTGADAVRRALDKPGAWDVMHSARNTSYRRARSLFFSAARASGGEPHLVRKFADTDGRPLYEIWKVRRPSGRRGPSPRAEEHRELARSS